MSDAPTPLLECRNVSKAFGAVQALYRVDFEVMPGEVMALVGDNGAGKSTLIKGIAGIYPYDEGEIFVEGKRVSIHGPRDAAKLGIEIVYQDLALADNLDVVANMFLGRERIRSGVVLDESSMETSARETLDGLSVTTLRSVRQAVAGLSGGQRQSVAVAKAVMWNSRVVILDEPTAALGVAQTRQVLNLVRRLAEKDLGVAIISHNLHDVFECADRITVLRLGQKVGLFETAKTNQEEIVHAITAGKLDHVPGMDTPVETEATETGHERPDRSDRRTGRARPCRRDRRHGRHVLDGQGLHAALVAGRPRRRARVAADHPRPRPHLPDLLAARRQLPDAAELHEPDPPDGGRGDDRDRRRLRPPDRRDRPFGRLRERGRRRRHDAAPATRRPGLAVVGGDRVRAPLHDADRLPPGARDHEVRGPVVRRHAWPGS